MVAGPTRSVGPGLSQVPDRTVDRIRLAAAVEEDERLNPHQENIV